MDRKAYYEQRRLQRVEAKRQWSSPSFSGITAALKEAYSVILYGIDEAEYFLIRKYRHKVSSRLLEKEKVLREKGIKQAPQFFSDLISRPSPLLAAISKDGFKGSAFVVPVNLQKSTAE